MSDELEAAVSATESVPESAKQPSVAVERKGRGPGLLLGFVLGLLVGAALAAILGPSEEPEPGSEVVAEGPGGMLSGLRSLVREASAQARQARDEAERAKRARYEELTRG